MPEEEKPITWIEVHYTCDDCAVGELRPVPDHYSQFGAGEYPHMCDYCGNRRVFYVKYPVIRYSGGDTTDVVNRTLANAARWPR